MRPHRFDVIAFETAAGAHPIRIKQSNRTAALLSGVALMTALAALIVVPQVVLAVYALAVPEARALVAAHPAAAVQLAIALGFWVLLVCWPLRHMLIRARHTRTIVIDQRRVTVTDKTLFGSSGWTARIADYRGIAHHVRTSLSGLSHELVLVHEDSANTLVLLAKEKMTEAEIEHWARELGIAITDAGGVYRLTRRHRWRPAHGRAAGSVAAAVA
jgi:hypothetical protein